MASTDEKSFDDINVTPMVDLYLVLLLIFIIMTTAGVQGMKVELPRASKAATADLGAPKMQAITITNEGKIALNTIPVTLAELEAKLTRHKATTPDFPVVVRGDPADAVPGTDGGARRPGPPEDRQDRPRHPTCEITYDVCGISRI